MKVLTAAEMREVDRRTIELGLDGPLLMENAGHRVVEVLAEKFGPLGDQRVLILCGKGNNGGDGLVVARQLLTRFRPKALWVVLAEAAPGNLRSFEAVGGVVFSGLSAEMRTATLVIDALLGTGLTGPPREPYAELIRAINEDFPLARVVAVDIPSGMASDTAETPWPHVKADVTMTFTALKVGQVLEPNASACGELVVGAIGSRDELLPGRTVLSEPAMFRELFVPRERTGHKGTYGHVLVVGGAHGKTGAAAMTAMAALRAGAGLVTMCSDAPPTYPEIMNEPLGGVEEVQRAAVGKTVLAIGPGLGINAMVGRLIETAEQPVILDADGLNSIAGEPLPRREDLVLTPHPGEMSRLSGLKTSEIQESRLDVAREFAQTRGVTLVLKGANTLTAFADGQVVINPTGNPGMATGGSGDVLTGIIAGLAAQFPGRLRTVVPAAVWLHGCAGDLAARAMGEQSMIATDILQFLPQAMDELRH